LRRFDFDDFTYLRNAESDFELELTFNYGGAEPYRHGDGYACFCRYCTRTLNQRFMERVGAAE